MFGLRDSTSRHHGTSTYAVTSFITLSTRAAAMGRPSKCPGPPTHVGITRVSRWDGRAWVENKKACTECATARKKRQRELHDWFCQRDGWVEVSEREKRARLPRPTRRASFGEGAARQVDVLLSPPGYRAAAGRGRAAAGREGMAGAGRGACTTSCVEHHR